MSSAAAQVPSPWFDAQEAAEYLRLKTVDQLHDMVRRGQIPVHRLGRRLRFHRLELDKMLGAPA